MCRYTSLYIDFFYLFLYLLIHRVEKNVKMWKWFVGSQQYIINTKYKRKSPRWSWGPEKVYIRSRPFTIVHSCHGNKNQAWYFGLPFPAAKAIISWTVQVFQCETCSSFHEQRFFSHHFGVYHRCLADFWGTALSQQTALGVLWEDSSHFLCWPCPYRLSTERDGHRYQTHSIYFGCFVAHLCPRF